MCLHAAELGSPGGLQPAEPGVLWEDFSTVKTELIYIDLLSPEPVCPQYAGRWDCSIIPAGLLSEFACVVLVAGASPGVDFLWAHSPSASLSPLQCMINPAGLKSSTSPNKASAGFSGFP